MIEREWSECAEPRPMLLFLHGKSSERKLRLFNCACCRSIRNLITDRRSELAVETAERLADGLADESECSTVYQAAELASTEAENRSHERTPDWCDYATTPPSTLESAISFAASACQRCLYRPVSAENAELVRYAFAAFVLSQLPEAARFLEDAEYYDLSFNKLKRVESAANDQIAAAQCNLLRDIFGNPFRPATLDPRWLSSTVLDLARTIACLRAPADPGRR